MIAATKWAWEQETDEPCTKLVLLAVASFCKADGLECWPSQQALAQMCQVTDRTIRRHLTVLEEVGLISREKRGGRSDMIVLRADTGVQAGPETCVRSAEPVETPQPETGVRSERKRVSYEQGKNKKYLHNPYGVMPRKCEPLDSGSEPASMLLPVDAADVPPAVVQGIGSGGTTPSRSTGAAFFPTRPRPGMSLARTIAVWSHEHQGTALPSSHGTIVSIYESVMDIVDENLDAGSDAHSRVMQALLIEFWKRETGGERPQPTAVRHLNRIVAKEGARRTLNVLAQALDWGAGLDEEYEKDNRAITKYMTAILNRENDPKWANQKVSQSTFHRVAHPTKPKSSQKSWRST